MNNNRDRQYVLMIKKFVIHNNYRHYIVCYYTINSDQINPIKLTPNNVDPYLCTHILVGFASVANCTIVLGKDLSIYQEMVALKKINPNLKVMVTVGGADNSPGFPEMVLNHANRKT